MTRPAGIPNKNKRGLLAELKRQYGKDFHPIMQMAAIAADTENEIRLRFDAWKEIAKYTEPQLKAVEHDIGGRLERHILAERQMTEEDFERKYPVDAPEGTAADTD